MISRRQFLAGLLALPVVPLVARAERLLPAPIVRDHGLIIFETIPGEICSSWLRRRYLGLDVSSGEDKTAIVMISEGPVESVDNIWISENPALG